MSPLQIFANEISSQGLWRKDIDLKRNEYLKVKGSVDLNIYYIQEGCLRIFVRDENEEHCIRFGYKDEFIASLDSFVSGEPSELYIQAIRQTKLKCIRKEVFMKMIKASPDLFELWYKMVEGLIFQQMERERDLLTASPSERYNRVLKRSPHLFQEVPHKYIASYLRMTPETLSRIKKS